MPFAKVYMHIYELDDSILNFEISAEMEARDYLNDLHMEGLNPQEEIAAKSIPCLKVLHDIYQTMTKSVSR